MLLYATMNFIDCGISIILAILIAFKGKDRKIVIPFVCWTSAIAIWSLGVGFHSLSDLSKSLTGSVFWSRFLHLGAVPLPVFYLHFVMNLCKKLQKKILVPVYLLTSLFFVLIPTKLFISEVSPIISFNMFPKIGPLYPFFVATFSFCVLYSFLILFLTLRELDGIKKNQILYVLIASSIGYSLGATAFLPMFNLPIFPFGTPFVILNAVLIAYAIIRFRAMDLNLVIRWGIAYGTAFFLVILSFLFGIYVVENVLGEYLRIGTGIPTLIAASAAVLLFEPLRRSMNRIVDRFIFKSPDFEFILTGIEQELKNLETVESVATRLIKHLKKIWNVEHAGIALWSSATSKFEMFPAMEFDNQIITSLKEEIKSTDFLIRTLESERRLFRYGIVVDDELTELASRASSGERTTFSKIRRTLRWLGAAVCVPLMVNEQLIGFLILGSKRDKGIYNDEDKKFLSHVADVVSIALKNLIISPSIYASDS